MRDAPDIQQGGVKHLHASGPACALGQMAPGFAGAHLGRVHQQAHHLARHLTRMHQAHATATR